MLLGYHGPHLHHVHASQAMHEPIKFGQSRDTFVCDFVKVVRMCCISLYKLYCDFKKIYNEE
jgi:hypothetical protein